jgi:hypothetical protein
VLLTVGLILARELPRWLPILYGAGLILTFTPVPNPTLSLPLALPWILGSGLIAARIVRPLPTRHATPGRRHRLTPLGPDPARPGPHQSGGGFRPSRGRMPAQARPTPSNPAGPARPRMPAGLHHA